MPDLVPVSQERHSGMVWRRFQSYDFVQDQPLVPVVLGEHEQVASALPMILAQTERGLWPVAVTRLGPRTALVAPNGVWRGSYVPSILRVHPFAMRATAGQAALLINEASGLLAQAPQPGIGWEPFFDPDGGLSPVLRTVVAYFSDRIQAETRTGAAVEALAQMGVLTAQSPFRQAEAAALLPETARHIDPAALAGLSRTDLAHLHRTEALSLAHAMLVARHHFSFLDQVEGQLDRIAAPLAPRRAALPEEEALAGFFDALATAQERG